jgi:hypothetical protein
MPIGCQPLGGMTNHSDGLLEKAPGRLQVSRLLEAPRLRIKLRPAIRKNNSLDRPFHLTNIAIS